jgi:hypothetical protein
VPLLQPAAHAIQHLPGSLDRFADVLALREHRARGGRADRAQRRVDLATKVSGHH